MAEMSEMHLIDMNDDDWLMFLPAAPSAAPSTAVYSIEARRERRRLRAQSPEWLLRFGPRPVAS